MRNRRMIYKRPVILILDSGTGGLFVYSMLQQLLPYINYLYLFDNRFFPYGNRSEEFIIRRVIAVIDVVYKCYKFDLVIIACNTISVVALKALRMYFKFPIIGVMPEIKLATKCTKNKVIGVLATHRTILSQYTINTVKCFESTYQIYLLKTAKLVVLAESKIYDRLISKLELQNILDVWLNLKVFPDTIVLGCTHFSLLKKELLEILPRGSCLIDSGSNVVDRIKYLLGIGNYIHKNGDNVYYSDKFSQNTAYYTMHNADILILRTKLLLYYNFFSVEMLSI